MRRVDLCLKTPLDWCALFAHQSFGAYLWERLSDEQRNSNVPQSLNSLIMSASWQECSEQMQMLWEVAAQLETLHRERAFNFIKPI